MLPISHQPISHRGQLLLLLLEAKTPRMLDELRAAIGGEAAVREAVQELRGLGYEVDEGFALALVAEPGGGK